MIKFVSHKADVERELERAVSRALDEIGDRAVGFAQGYAPVDTGNMRASITHERVDDSSEGIGCSDALAPYKDPYYAKFVELGTTRMAAQPFLTPAANNHGAEYVQIVKDVLGI